MHLHKLQNCSHFAVAHWPLCVVQIIRSHFAVAHWSLYVVQIIPLQIYVYLTPADLWQYKNCE